MHLSAESCLSDCDVKKKELYTAYKKQVGKEGKGCTA